MKSVKVHDDTHRALKKLKSKRRSRSIDQVIREMMRSAGVADGDDAARGEGKITSYLDE